MYAVLIKVFWRRHRLAKHVELKLLHLYHNRMNTVSWFYMWNIVFNKCQNKIVLFFINKFVCVAPLKSNFCTASIFLSRRVVVPIFSTCSDITMGCTLASEVEHQKILPLLNDSSSTSFIQFINKVASGCHDHIFFTCMCFYFHYLFILWMRNKGCYVLHTHSCRCKVRISEGSLILKGVSRFR